MSHVVALWGCIRASALPVHSRTRPGTSYFLAASRRSRMASSSAQTSSSSTVSLYMNSQRWCRTSGDTSGISTVPVAASVMPAENILSKTGDLAASTSLCACSCWPPAESVTSLQEPEDHRAAMLAARLASGDSASPCEPQGLTSMTRSPKIVTEASMVTTSSTARPREGSFSSAASTKLGKPLFTFGLKASTRDLLLSLLCPVWLTRERVYWPRMAFLPPMRPTYTPTKPGCEPSFPAG
mmetsp:Transcript_125546/g.366728  ORF Transcript_125546/g.366728 Transcript_125546/m.366728 type:complete len:240 (-) Transcript_125546:116-835(-)